MTFFLFLGIFYAFLCGFSSHCNSKVSRETKFAHTQVYKMYTREKCTIFVNFSRPSFVAYKFLCSLRKSSMKWAFFEEKPRFWALFDAHLIAVRPSELSSLDARLIKLGNNLNKICLKS